MKHNERGFIYPVVLILCFALFYTVMMLSEMMASERKYLRLEERMFEESQLLIAGAQFAMNRIESRELLIYPAEFRFDHSNSVIVCYINTIDHVMYSVEVKAESSSGRKKKASFRYEKEENKLIDWTEQKG